MARNPIVFQNGTLVSNAKVEIDGTVYDVTPAQYEGTTPLSANNLNQLQTNIYDYVDEEIEGITDVYSTSETQTDKVWIDGKPIYRKVVLITTTSNSNITQAHGITNLDKFWINYDASFIFDNNESLPPNWYYSSNDWGRLWINTSDIRFRSPSSLGTRTLYAVVEYTKTTD